MARRQIRPVVLEAIIRGWRVGRYRCGQIILAYVDDGQGRTKERPCMILTRDADIKPGSDVQVVAITTSVNEEVLPPFWIPIPYGAPYHPETGL